MSERTWTDEQLSAFLDGELPPDDMDMLSRDMEQDAHLAERIERLGSANAVYVDAIGQIDAVPMKESLKAALGQRPAAKVVAFRPRSVMGFVMEHRAIAASLVCAAVVWGLTATGSGGASSDPFGPGPDGLIMANSPLYQMLERTSTGEASVVGGSSAVPRLTFVSDDGSFCRQFDVAAAGVASAAIACREDGSWRTQVVAYGLTLPAGDFQTASASRSPVLETFLDERMSGAPMNAEQEARLLQSGWASQSQ